MGIVIISCVCLSVPNNITALALQEINISDIGLNFAVVHSTMKQANI